MPLIIGGQALPNIDKLYKAYSSYCLESTGLSKDYKYHPLMGLKSNVSWISKKEWLYLSAINDVLDFSVENLNILNKTLPTISTLTPLFGRNPRYTIDPNYNIHNPKARDEFKLAISIFEKACPWQYELFQLIITQVCPIMNKGSFRFDGGASDYNLIGMIFTGVKPKPNNILNLAISLSHELGHNIFMLYQAGQYPIQKTDFKKEVYSGVRKVNRPSLAAFHACVALGYMISFCESALNNLCLDTVEKSYLENELLRYKINLHEGISAIREIKLSELGGHILAELSNILKQ